MANHTSLASLFSDIADAIRAKTGGSSNIIADNFPTAISQIPTGGTPTLQTKTKTYTPTTSQQTEQVRADNGYDGLEQVNVTVNAMPTGSAGTPTASKGTVSDHSVTVTPSVTNTTGYINGGTKTGTGVSVSASELVSGTKSITQNGTGIDVANYASVDVNVSGGGGASLGTKTITANGTYDAEDDGYDGYSSVDVNVSGGGGGGSTETPYVTGTFTTGSSSGASEVSIPYTGTGYPIMAVVVVDGGAYNPDISDWYNSMQRYAVGQWTLTKSVFTSTPTYTSSGTQNQGVITSIYKNSTTSSTSYTRTSSMNVNTFYNSSATNSQTLCVRFRSNTRLSYFVAGTSYGLLANTTYRYFIVYSA